MTVIPYFLIVFHIMYTLNLTEVPKKQHFTDSLNMKNENYKKLMKFTLRALDKLVLMRKRLHNHNLIPVRN